MNETMQEYVMSDRIWERFAVSEKKWLERFCELLSLQETPLVLGLPGSSPNTENRLKRSQLNRVSEKSGRIFTQNIENTDEDAFGQPPKRIPETQEIFSVPIQKTVPQQFLGREILLKTAPEMSEEETIRELLLPHGDEVDPERDPALFREIETYLEQAILEELGSSAKGVY